MNPYKIERALEAALYERTKVGRGIELLKSRSNASASFM